MKFPWTKDKATLEKKEVATLDQILSTIAGMYETVSGISVTPENCMRSPTVHAIISAVQNRLSVSEVKVMLTSTNSKGRVSREHLPNHPVAKLLRKPNSWQTQDEYFSDATSSLLRYGRYFAYKGRGATGPIQFLQPIVASEVDIETDRDSLAITYRVNGDVEYDQKQIHYIRLGARDYVRGDSPVMDVRASIALEIAAEQFGASFFGNGAMPLIYFSMMEGFSDFETEDEKIRFLRAIKENFGGSKKFSSMMLPQGMEMNSVEVDNNKAQFIETRKFIRTVIAGAFGVPPHLVGDLERATFNNVEQQDTDFTLNVVLPVAQRIEAAMMRDLLTDADRAAGVVIRFDLDNSARADIKTRNEALRVAREWGAINANEWREKLGLNPLTDDEGGEDYIRPMNMQEAGEEPPEPAPVNPPADDDDPDEEPVDKQIRLLRGSR